jgi:hypothetical protein
MSSSVNLAKLGIFYGQGYFFWVCPLFYVINLLNVLENIFYGIGCFCLLNKQKIWSFFSAGVKILAIFEDFLFFGPAK